MPQVQALKLIRHKVGNV